MNKTSYRYCLSFKAFKSETKSHFVNVFKMSMITLGSSEEYIICNK